MRREKNYCQCQDATSSENKLHFFRNAQITFYLFHCMILVTENLKKTTIKLMTIYIARMQQHTFDEQQKLYGDGDDTFVYK